MTFLIDENLSHRIAGALKALGKPVEHVTQILPKGTPDEVIFNEVSRRGWFLLTQDHKIMRRKHQREAMLQAGIGAFIFRGRTQRSVDEQTIMVLQRYEEIEGLAGRTPRPFRYTIPDRGRIQRAG